MKSSPIIFITDTAVIKLEMRGLGINQELLNIEQL
jgi:hypothetical protein